MANRPATFVLLCAALPALAGSVPQTLRVTGIIEPLHSLLVQAPRVEGQGGNLTLTELAPNGVHVETGQLLAEFDATKENQALLDAAAKYDDLTHQVDQKDAEHRNNAAKRQSDLQQASADLEKAQIELRKGPILTDIDRVKNDLKLQDAREHAASLKTSAAFHERAEAAESRILILQRDRQKLAVERARGNINRLQLHSTLSGMVALKNVFRNGSMGHAQVGDQLWPGSPLMLVFDPGQMEVSADIQEPDLVTLGKDTRAVVHLDAYPGAAFPAVFESASPVASSAMDSSIKTFKARFLVSVSDPRLLPDLSAAVDIELPPAKESRP